MTLHRRMAPPHPLRSIWTSAPAPRSLRQSALLPSWHATPRHAHGSVSVDNMYDKLDRLHCASDITNLLAAAEAARWYAADQYCMSGSSTWKTQHRCLERLCDEATT